MIVKKVNKRRRLWLFCLLCFCTLLLLLSLGKRGFIQQVRVWQNRRHLELEVQTLEERKMDLENECERLNDPDKIEEVAREKYGMAKKNETVYQIVPEGQ